MKKTNELFITLGWEVISAVLWTGGLLNSAPDFFFISFSIPLSSLSLSLPSSAYEQRGEYIYYTQGNYWSMEELVANCSWLIDPEALTPRSVTKSWEESCVAASCFSCLNCVLKQGFFVYWYTPPPFPKKLCVFTYSNKAFLCIESFG